MQNKFKISFIRIQIEVAIYSEKHALGLHIALQLKPIIGQSWNLPNSQIASNVW